MDCRGKYESNCTGSRKKKHKRNKGIPKPVEIKDASIFTPFLRRLIDICAFHFHELHTYFILD